MFVDFSVKNFGPFRDKATLSMVKTHGNEHSENCFECEAINGEILNSVAIFGPNATGKSYMIRAIDTMIWYVLGKNPTETRSPAYMPFRLNMKCLDAPCEMSIHFTDEGGILYEYNLAVNAYEIDSESAYYSPNGRKSKIFQRNGDEIEFGSKFKNKMNKIKDLRKKALPFLFTANQMNIEICSKIHNWIVSKIIIIPNDPSSMLLSVVDMIGKNPRIKEKVLRALKLADFAITDIAGDFIHPIDPAVALRKDAIQVSNSKTGENGAYFLLLKHSHPDADVSDESSTMSFEVESSGTIQAICLLGPMVQALEDGAVIFCDEFGSYFHTDLSKYILNQFKYSSNPNKAQIIINTHDQNLMDTEELYRRDQIYLTNKDRKTGASELYSISDFNGIRNTTDIKKAYQSGRFDAIPFISSGDLIQ